MSEDTSKRSYDNSLREQQAQATRERILEAMAEQLSADPFAEFSVAQVAKRAGVSEPTIYRHFGGRKGLFAAFSPWFERRSGHPGYPVSLRDLIQQGIDGAYAYFDANELYIRAGQTPQLAELVGPGRVERRQKVADMLTPTTAALAPDAARRVKALFGYLIGSRAYLALKDDFGLSTNDAARVMNWAVRVLAADLEAGGQP